MTRFERLTLATTAVALAVTVGGFVVVYFQLRNANEALSGGVNASVSTWTFEIDKAFLEHPELRPYFYGGQDIAPDDPNFHKAEAMAEFLLDSFDSIESFKGDIPAGIPHEGWVNWIYDCYGNSPLLRRYAAKQSRWYQSGPAWWIYEKWKHEHPAAGGPLQAEPTK